MNDECIEQRLREAWEPSPPTGMRERVLVRARNEVRRHTRTQALRRQWQIALASAAVLIILASNLADVARASRIQVLVDGSSSTPVAISAHVQLAWGDIAWGDIGQS